MVDWGIVCQENSLEIFGWEHAKKGGNISWEKLEEDSISWQFFYKTTQISSDSDGGRVKKYSRRCFSFFFSSLLKGKQRMEEKKERGMMVGCWEHGRRLRWRWRKSKSSDKTGVVNLEHATCLLVSEELNEFIPPFS